jgi:hypothetical protein
MNPLNAKFTISLFLTIIPYIFSESISLKYHFIFFSFKKFLFKYLKFLKFTKKK